tara:strand:+ start:143 stop:301 length:159 start_codon:yes stop_codon:yes gene_type:complete
MIVSLLALKETKAMTDYKESKATLAKMAILVLLAILVPAVILALQALLAQQG